MSRIGLRWPMIVTFAMLALISAESGLLAAPHGPHAGATVQIARFSAAWVADLITLNWNTVGEVDNFGFEIERRSQFDSEWRTIAYVRGRGTERSGQNYSFVERMQAQAVISYRLKQIDQSGRSLYSRAVTVTPDVLTASMRVRPSPGRNTAEYNQVSFVLPSEGTVKVSVYDAFGRELDAFAHEQQMSAGYHVIPFGFAKLAPGVYSVRCETGDGTLVEPLIKY